MKKRHLLQVGIIILFALIIGFVDIPAENQKSIFPVTPQALLDSKFHLGLDLQGGSQLDYKMDLSKVQAKDQQSIIDGVLNVINNRVNGLGVSEPNIYISSIGDEKHLIVELAGIKDLEKAKEVVGKTIQLEFKEQRKGEDTNAVADAKKGAQDLLNKIKDGGDIMVLGKEAQQSNLEKITFQEVDYQYKDQTPAGLTDTLFKLKKGELVDAPVEITGNTPSFNIIKIVDRRDQERQIDQKAESKVSHILIAYAGATRADKSITRTESEAKTRAEEVLSKLQKGEKFEDIAKTYSDDKVSGKDGGVLPDPATENDNYAKEFHDAAMALKKPGDLSPITKSSFGYHIIKLNSSTPASSEKKVEPQVKYINVAFSSKPDPWQATGLTGLQFTHANVEFSQTYQPYVSIQFNDEGAKLFEEISGRNVGKPVAMFVGGKLISAPRVDEKIAGGKAQITGNYTIEEATNLARDLNTGAIPAPIVLVGQHSIGATLGQDALAKSLWAGLIGFLLIAIFMICYYRLPGLLSVLALGVYSIIMLFLIKMALPLYWSLAISIAIFVFLVTKILNSRESGPEKAVSLIISCFILFFLSFLLSTAVVMTLAGIAGVILSIGMAVDANILIFERVKEELRDGRPLSTAIEVGFDRAWSSIRDSNFSSLITCGILFYFGSSIIQGFAFNLAAGILVSMFTAITVSKTFIAALANTKLAQNLWLFGAPKKKDKKLLPVIQTRKFSYIVSAALLIAALIGVPIFGMKLGLDFTGGTFLELKFEKQTNVDQIKKALDDSVINLNNQIDKGQIPTIKNENSSVSTQQSQQTSSQAASTKPDSPNVMTAIIDKNQASLIGVEGKLDLGQPLIIPSEGKFLIKTRHISTNQHDLLLTELKKQFGNIEETRFTTVGPTVGESLRYKAIIAVIIASVMIILYIAFAFRKIPRHIGKWKFGTAAIVALLHDLGIMLGVYVYFGVFFGVEIDALFITALLTIMGFSVHDTIVVFDRIREKLKYQKREETFADIANQAVNETIGRSINTSLAVFLSLTALAIFGSESIRFFVLSLMVGIVAGTYSSIFIATPILVDWNEYEKKQSQLAHHKK